MSVGEGTGGRCEIGTARGCNGHSESMQGVERGSIRVRGGHCEAQGGCMGIYKCQRGLSSIQKQC